jgi:hypothetical protein
MLWSRAQEVLGYNLGLCIGYPDISRSLLQSLHANANRPPPRKPFPVRRVSPMLPSNQRQHATSIVPALQTAGLCFRSAGLEVRVAHTWICLDSALPTASAPGAGTHSAAYQPVRARRTVDRSIGPVGERVHKRSSRVYLSPPDLLVYQISYLRCVRQEWVHYSPWSPTTS